MESSNSNLLAIHLPIIPIPVMVLSWMLIVGSSWTCEAHDFKDVGPVSFNEVDKCWKGDPNWQSNRKNLADCPKGYGAYARGGKDGPIYMVTDKTDDPINPRNGTLRFGAIQNGPLWIIFHQNIHLIQLKSELYVSSYKTLDGRDTNIRIGDGPCVRIENASHVIIHNLIFERCGIADPGLVRVGPDRVRSLGPSSGDAIVLVGATHVWIDHSAFDNCAGRLITLSYVSTMVTISNNIFQGNSKVMMFGHSDQYYDDKYMRVTVMYNQFRDQLVKEIPRVRFGYVHIANNMYYRWIDYAIGGSANPTILSECNNYTAHDNINSKEITWRPKEVPKSKWRKWSWTSKEDLFFNLAYFIASGEPWEPSYLEPERFTVASAYDVPDLVRTAGPTICVPNWPC